jgi:hypothetical protein
MRSPVVVLIALLLAAFSSVLMAQANRGTELDKAYEEARARAAPMKPPPSAGTT